MASGGSGRQEQGCLDPVGKDRAAVTANGPGWDGPGPARLPAGMNGGQGDRDPRRVARGLPEAATSGGGPERLSGQEQRPGHVSDVVEGQRLKPEIHQVLLEPRERVRHELARPDVQDPQEAGVQEPLVLSGSFFGLGPTLARRTNQLGPEGGSASVLARRSIGTCPPMPSDGVWSVGRS